MAGEITQPRQSAAPPGRCRTTTRCRREPELAQLGTKIAGAVWASTQNKHGAPGICASSGDPLFKIYRASGDVRYADLMHDILHAHAEGIQPDGEICERLTYCDADSRGTARRRFHRME